MKFCNEAFGSSIGQKVIMASTGLLMCLFLVGHFLGNLLLYVGKDPFNQYANALSSTKLIYLAEFGLVAILALHVFSAIKLTAENRRARPEAYKKKNTAGKATWMSSYMFHSGMVVLIFILFHIYSFKFGAWDNHLVRYPNTLYDHVTISFQSLPYSSGYVVGVVFLGFHLSHAFKSAFITLGIARKSTLKTLNRASEIFSILVAAGFSSFPIYFYFF